MPQNISQCQMSVWSRPSIYLLHLAVLNRYTTKVLFHVLIFKWLVVNLMPRAFQATRRSLMNARITLITFHKITMGSKDAPECFPDKSRIILSSNRLHAKQWTLLFCCALTCRVPQESILDPKCSNAAVYHQSIILQLSITNRIGLFRKCENSIEVECSSSSTVMFQIVPLVE